MSGTHGTTVLGSVSAKVKPFLFLFCYFCGGINVGKNERARAYMLTTSKKVLVIDAG